MCAPVETPVRVQITGYVHRLYMGARAQTGLAAVWTRCTAAICSDNRCLSTHDVSGGGGTYRGDAERAGERRWKGWDDEKALGGRGGLKRTSGEMKEVGRHSASGCFQAQGCWRTR